MVHSDDIQTIQRLLPKGIDIVLTQSYHSAIPEVFLYCGKYKTQVPIEYGEYGNFTMMAHKIINHYMPFLAAIINNGD